eukprot:38911-Chlamydomonas_euryale.AAC.8
MHGCGTRHPGAAGRTRPTISTTKLNMRLARIKIGRTRPAADSANSDGCGKSVIDTFHDTWGSAKLAVGRLAPPSVRDTARCRNAASTAAWSGIWTYRFGSWKSPLKNFCARCCAGQHIICIGPKSLKGKSSFEEPNHMPALRQICVTIQAAKYYQCIDPS